jgi:hypothetical protein
MNLKSVIIVFALAGFFGGRVVWAAESPAIPPAITRFSPVGLQRGSTATFTVEGRNLGGLTNVLFDAPGLSAKLISITDIPEPPQKIRVNVDTSALVPRGTKQEAKLEITASMSVMPGIHWYRIQTELGTSNLMAFDVGALPEVQHEEKKDWSDSQAGPQMVKLPATLEGTLSKPGEADSFSFEARAGQELVFQVVAEPLGSKLRSELKLEDSAGHTVAEAGKYDLKSDALLIVKVPADGKYTVSIGDRERSGGDDHFYRLRCGQLPYITSVFPMGVQAGKPAQVSIAGVNLGGVHELIVTPPAKANGWHTMPITAKTPAGISINQVKLAVGDTPEILEAEPNDTVAQAERVAVPVTINGHIWKEGKGGSPDQDNFRFSARKGESLTIEVAAARLGSPLDSVIEVLDDQGHAIPRATVRCLAETFTTLSDRDSRRPYFRLINQEGLHVNDYIMIGDELDQIAYIPDQPDADVEVKGLGDQRFTYLGTSPSVHPVNTPVYRAELLPPNAKFPSNGLPVFNLVYRSDDGGPGFGADSRLEFVAPKDGEYILNLKDVRGDQGKEFAYRLTIRKSVPDFTITATPANPNIPLGGSAPVTITANRTLGYEGPITLEVQDLSKGITVRPAMIPAGQESASIIFQAGEGVAASQRAESFRIVGKALIDGREVERVANPDMPLQMAAVMPPPDVVVSAEEKEISIQPGQTITVTLHVRRQNGYKGRVPCRVLNLPPGVREVNVGLNGILVTEQETSTKFTLLAENWAKPAKQPIYIAAEVESNVPTYNTSGPVELTVQLKEVASSVQKESKKGMVAPGP